MFPILPDVKGGTWYKLPQKKSNCHILQIFTCPKVRLEKRTSGLTDHPVTLVLFVSPTFQIHLLSAKYVDKTRKSLKVD